MHKPGNRLAAVAALSSVILVGLALTSQTSRANREGEQDSRVRIGFQISPVPLNLHGRNRELVGLGSYIMNAASDCNSCHTMNQGAFFSPGQNPYFGQFPAKVNPDVYLGGGEDFGTLDPKGLSAHI